MGDSPVIARTTAKSARKIRNVQMKRGERATSTSLSGAELAEFRGMLLAKRRELLGDIGAMEHQGARDPPELLESERDLLCQIDEALARIENGTYGICEATGTPITKARLGACPWARHCIEYARWKEKPKMLVARAYRRHEDDADEPAVLETWEFLRRTLGLS